MLVIQINKLDPRTRKTYLQLSFQFVGIIKCVKIQNNNFIQLEVRGINL